MSSGDDLNENDLWQIKSGTVVWEFGKALTALHESNPWPDFPLLPSAMSSLMTELWDNGFSQSEIREAFEGALAHMPAYAAGEERRT